MGRPPRPRNCPLRIFLNSFSAPIVMGAAMGCSTRKPLRPIGGRHLAASDPPDYRLGVDAGIDDTSGPITVRHIGNAELGSAIEAPMKLRDGHAVPVQIPPERRHLLDGTHARHSKLLLERAQVLPLKGLARRL